MCRRDPTSGLDANVFGDSETWLSWGASTDNATPTGLIVYEVFLNGQFDQGVGGGQTQAILYAEQCRLNTIDVVAVDGAGNRSAPASTTVDCSSGGCQRGVECWPTKREPRPGFDLGGCPAVPLRQGT